MFNTVNKLRPWLAGLLITLPAFAGGPEPALTLLETRCTECHGPDKQKGKFRVDRRATLLSGGDSGEPAVVPGKPDDSFLVKVVSHEIPDLEMPPKGDRLTDVEIHRIKAWIQAGAATPESYGGDSEKTELTHWAFLPVKRPVSADGIDGLIRNKLKAKGLTPSGEADRRTLIRRLYLVMLGLPPTPEQVETFLADKDPKAWEELVEQVLASPHYGERWAAHWLDLVRFGETHGFEMNRERPTAWPYRDWVIAAFNNDKPYNEFVREQIAGDALGVDIGTSFLVAGPVDQVKGSDPKLGQMQRMNELDDMINTTGTAFLGLTTGCARCHNHKFDPISQKDYYAMQAIFAGVRHGDRNLPLSADAKARMAEIDQELATLRKHLESFIPPAGGPFIALDETEAEHFQKPQGRGDNPIGPEPNLSRGAYTWWTNAKGQDIAAWHPKAKGLYRIWLSWGAGFPTHTTDARYFLNGKEIARVNQQLPADGSGKVDNQKRWSGLYDAGVHALSPGDKLLLRGGETGTAVTADIVVFQAVTSDAPTAPPSYRDPVNAKHNTEVFAPRKARFVRFTIEQSSGGQPCIDELEIFSEGRNVALASLGAKASSSGDFVHALHKLAQINDGHYGNAKSWISAQTTGGWVQIELPKVREISRIEWARDRQGQYKDRTAIGYRIEAAVEAGKWAVIASHQDRQPFNATLPAAPRYDFAGHPPDVAAQGKAWLKALEAGEQARKQLSGTRKVYAGTFAQPGPTHRLYRGEPDAKREQVTPGAITALTGLTLPANAPEKDRRLAFADWVADPKNPLTPRVIANRLWQFHFGVGIVDTPSDFGRNGTQPSHPEIIDWLAAELVEKDWSLKHLHRLILTSHTWRQDNKPRSDAMRIDAASRLLWRFPTRRLEAEGIRDSMLAASGTINLEQRGGPGFSPFEVHMENVRHYHAKKTYGPEDWRRMIYMTKVRQEREQVFGAFDCPDASMVVAKRSRSTTPLQALNLLNSSFVMQQADLFAQRLTEEAPDDRARVERAWQLCFQRYATEADIADSLAFIAEEGLVQFTRALLNANEFVFIP